MTPHHLLFNSNRNQQQSNHTINGVLIGVVTDNKDPEGLARVKLNFPSLAENNETDWVRIATLMSGKDRGSLFIPEVGDEVLVAFQQGDMRSPFVIGSLWHEKEEAPAVHEKNNIRKLKSRSGHELIFDDEGTEGKVTVLSSKGHKVELDDKNDQIIISDQSNKNKVEISGGTKNEVVITSDATTITLKAQGEILIESKMKVKVKSTNIDVEAQAQLNINAGAGINMKSDGLIMIKGSMVKIN